MSPHGLPDGYDPDAYIREHGAEAIRAMCRSEDTPQPVPDVRPFKARRARLQRRRVSGPFTEAELRALCDEWEERSNAVAIRRAAATPTPYEVSCAEAGRAKQERVREEGVRKRAEEEARRSFASAVLSAIRARCRLIVWSAAHPGVAAPRERPQADPDLRMRAWLAAIPGGVRGQGDHSAGLAKVAIGLTQGWCLSEHEAVSVMMDDYAARCDPRWSRREVEAKVRWAGRATRCGRGWLRDRVR